MTIADFWYVLGAIKREEYDVDAQEVRAYFSFDRVLPGVLETTGRLLDVQYVPADVATWHDDVQSYDVLRGDDVLGRIHLDLHPREGKFNHAACFGLAPGVTGRVLPEAVLLCNFARGLLTHDEVVTFFHEFGHLVHDILGGAQHWARFTGVATEWDFVEAPSQLLEEWAWDPAVLATFTANADGDPIPAELVERMRTADAFGRALEVRRQLGHARVSYHLHVDRPDGPAGGDGADLRHVLARPAPARAAPLRGVRAPHRLRLVLLHVPVEPRDRPRPPVGVRRRPDGSGGRGALPRADPRARRQPGRERPGRGVPGSPVLLRRLPGVAHAGRWSRRTASLRTWRTGRAVRRWPAGA